MHALISADWTGEQPAIAISLINDNPWNSRSTPGFRRNATHCISPHAIVKCVCVCVCLCVCVYAAFVHLRKTV